jgi:hypothetical protein
MEIAKVLKVFYHSPFFSSTKFKGRSFTHAHTLISAHGQFSQNSFSAQLRLSVCRRNEEWDVKIYRIKMKFADSCQTLSLKTSEIFISSFPGKIVFGEPNSLGYSNLQSFQYKHHQFLNLYLSFVNIVQFFASNSNNTEKGLILTQEVKIQFIFGVVKVLFKKIKLIKE